jgi:hypothetical protein
MSASLAAMAWRCAAVFWPELINIDGNIVT